MNSAKAELRKRIHELDFALHELKMFLDSHPENQKAISMLRDYRGRRQAAVDEFERGYGKYVVTSDQVEPENRWTWIDGPWPWENDFMEA